MDRRIDSDQFPQLDVRLVVLDLLGTLPATRKPPLEQVFDALLAASVASWAVLGWMATTAPPSFVRAAVCLLHLTVAAAIARRARLERIGSPGVLLRAAPALVVAGLTFRLAAPLETWPVGLELLFGLGAVLAIVSFASLGESFSILPAQRGVVSQGPYRVVRHPAYAGELLMMTACMLSNRSASSLAVLSIALAFVVVRIITEERFLSASSDYVRYARAVRHRLVPGLW